MSVDGLSLTKPTSTLKGSSGKYMNVSQKSCHIKGGYLALFLWLSGLKKSPKRGNMFDNFVSGVWRGAAGRSNISGGNVI